MIDTALSLLASFAGALLFGWAALHKWRALREFAATVEEYRLLPASLATAAATILAAAETVVCGAQLWAATRPAAAAAAAALLLMYACAMAINLARGRRQLDCGCGLGRRSISGTLVLRNLLLAAFVALPMLATTGRVLTGADHATVLAALVVGSLLYAAAELLLGRSSSGGFSATEAS